MVFLHAIHYWMPSEYHWFWAILYLIITGVGVPGFTFISGFAFGYAWQKDIKKGLNNKEIYLKGLARGIVLLVTAFIYNFFAVVVHNYGWENIWFWYILQTLAFSRLYSLATAKLSPIIRGLIAIGIILITPTILNYLNLARMDNASMNVLYFLLFNPVGNDAILFIMPFFVFGVLLGEFLYKIHTLKIYPVKSLRWILIAGGICLGIG